MGNAPDALSQLADLTGNKPSWEEIKMGIDRLVYTRPTEQYLYVEREPVQGKCPACGSEDIKRYPVIDHIGPKIVVKCQNCLHTISREKPKPEDNWLPFQSAAFDWPASPAEGGKVPSEGDITTK